MRAEAQSRARVIDAADTPGLILDVLTDNVKRLADGVRQDPNAAPEAFRKLGAFSLPLAEVVGEETLGEITETNRQVLAAASIDGRIARDPDRVLARFDKDGYKGSDLPKVTLASLRDKAKRESEKQRQSRADAKGVERARFIEDIERRVEAGEAGAGEIAALRESGTLGPNLGARLASRAEFRRAEIRRNAEQRQAIAAVARGEAEPGDVSNPTYRRAVGDYYKSTLLPALTSGIGGAPPAGPDDDKRQADRVASFVARTGVPPNRLKAPGLLGRAADRFAQPNPLIVGVPP